METGIQNVDSRFRGHDKRRLATTNVRKPAGGGGIASATAVGLIAPLCGEGVLCWIRKHCILLAGSITLSTNNTNTAGAATPTVVGRRGCPPPYSSQQIPTADSFYVTLEGAAATLLPGFDTLVIAGLHRPQIDAESWL